MLGVCNYRTMEAKSRQIIMQHCPECMYGSVAVPIEKLAEKVFGLELDYQYITKHGKAVLGKLVCSDGLTAYYDTELKKYCLIEVKAKTVMIEARLLEDGNNGRYRFTVAHELAHWILHKEKIIELQKEAACGEVISDESMEKQADYFASAILMPLGAVKIYYHSLCGKHMNRDEIITDMSEHFEVSKQAMQIRLQSHNLI